MLPAIFSLVFPPLPLLKSLTMAFCTDVIEARCAHFGICGGCSAQTLPYDQQLEQKEMGVRALFPDVPCAPIIGCEEAWEWRNKMEFTFSQSKEGERFLGLFMRGKKGRVLTLDECHLTAPWFVETLHTLFDWWEESGLTAYFPPADRGELRTLTLRHGVHTGEKMAVLTTAAPLPDSAKKRLAEILAHFDSVIIRRQRIEKGKPTRFEEEVVWGSPYILEELGPYLFRIRPSTFFQPNTVQAERLYERAAHHVEGERLLDLYCGTGAIGIFCSKKVHEVIGVEITPGGEENIALNGISNMRLLVGEVEKQKEKLPPADCALIDPPRAGLTPSVVRWLKERKFKKLIYISCNPKSQARDCRALLEGGYALERVEPVDQFPHTPHVENIALLAHL